MNNAKRERVKRIIKCMKFQLIFNRLLINLQLKWLINGCSTYWYTVCVCVRETLNGLIDTQTEAIRLTKVLAWRMDAAATAEQEISAITTHTHTTTKRKKENRQDAATDEMIHWGHWTWWQSSSERARWGREMYGKCLQTFAWNQQINKASTVRPTRDSEGETWRASEKNFMWQVKWKFLHKSKLKVLKIAKGLKLNFTILTSAKGCSREGGKESSLFFFWLCYLGNPSHSHCPHPSCATVKRVRLTFMRCSCSAAAPVSPVCTFIYLLDFVFSVFGARIHFRLLCLPFGQIFGCLLVFKFAVNRKCAAS